MSDECGENIPELGTWNPEPGTRNPEPGTVISEAIYKKKGIILTAL
jgi:hypothetical protein